MQPLPSLQKQQAHVNSASLWETQQELLKRTVPTVAYILREMIAPALLETQKAVNVLETIKVDTSHIPTVRKALQLFLGLSGTNHDSN